ncbi:hypothetical protein MMC22_004848 [Lobaria immixta]|nr:hypothetical protein [Lobaria immixta]
MKHFREHEGVIDERIIKLHYELNQRFAQTGQVFDFAEWARWFLNDTVTHFTFGEPTGFISEGRDIDGLIKALHSMGIMTGLVAALPWLFEPLIKNRFLKRFILPQSGNKTGSGKIMTHRDKLVMKRLDEAGTKEHDDVLAVLLKTKTLDGGKPSILDIKAECLSFMIAASDTTAGLVSPLIASVIERPKVYEKLMLEIDRFEREERISRPVASFDETNEMAYFMSCVKETLRLFPPTPIILPRFVCQGGLNLGEHMHIPEGTEIAANPWVTNRDPTVFGRDANKFRPERWLEVNELQFKEMEKLIFTFGHGSRECIGKNLALLEAQKLCLQVSDDENANQKERFHVNNASQLLREFELRSTSPNKPWTCKDRGISIYENQWMTLQARRPYDDSGSK